ncbi:carbonic anhydrase [Kineococcus sp. T13]|uniref:carbonic anhydrase n=1 Tax=Kineococcus vitellinus TaxID=2696565 RepID=UPI0014126BF8|nr:carbonic anhydrase [Kineococcus vitellinus]NAZ76748.1 carbonic anhydrase [Kineococcus vitellinus]
MTTHGSTLPANDRTAPPGAPAAPAGVGSTRRGLLHWAAALGGGTLLTACGSSTSPAAPAAAPERPDRISDPEQALELLRAGNARFSAHPEQHTTHPAAHRLRIAEGQHPFAIVLSCADSRVPPELVFDQDLGDLFVVRTAGQVVAPPVLGSIQYGVEHLHVPLIVVLGHESCGAVGATLEAVRTGSAPSGTAIDSLVEAIRPAAEQALAETDADSGSEADEAQHLAEAVRLNVAAEVAQLSADPLLAEAVDGGHLRVVGATYDLHEGTVTFL